MIKRCGVCGSQKPIQQFKKDRNYKSGYSSTCLACNAETKRNWYARNSEYARDWFKQYYATTDARYYYMAHHHNTRAKRRGLKADLTPEQLKQLFKDNPKCCYCGNHEATEIDHVHPIHKGGPSTISNLVAVCHKCQVTKWHDSLYESVKKGKLMLCEGTPI